MKKIVLSMVVVLSMIVSFTSFAEIKIAVVNAGVVFDGTNLGAVSVKEMENSLRPAVMQIESKRKAIVEDTKKLSTDAKTLTKVQTEKKYIALTQRQEAFNKEYKALEDRQYQKQKAMADKFENYFSSAIEQVAKEHGYNLIVKTESLLYADKVDDVSSQVISIMNKNSK